MKVDFSFSEEGKNTIMNFYLSGPWYSEQSYTHPIHQGTGNHYYAVYQNCKNMNVGLAIYNNNDVKTKYYVAGYWDEETDKHNFSYK